jgi:hypothetical protein
MHACIKRITLLLFCVGGLSPIVSSAQDSTTFFIEKIRATYQKINTMQLKKVDVNAKEEASEGGEVNRYYDRDTLRKIVSEYLGAIGRQKTEFYFLDRQLCFALVTFYQYDGYMTGRVKEKKVYRYYFHNRQLIRWIDEQGRIQPKSLYAEKAKEILNDEDLK